MNYVKFTMMISNFTNANLYGGKWTNNPLYYVSPTFPYASSVNGATSTWNDRLTPIGSPIKSRMLGGK